MHFFYTTFITLKMMVYFEDKGRLDKYLVPLVNVGARNNVNITDKEFLNGTICIRMSLDLIPIWLEFMMMPNLESRA